MSWVSLSSDLFQYSSFPVQFSIPVNRHMLGVLFIIIQTDIRVRDPSGNLDFLQPSLHDRLTLDYQHLEYGLETTSIRWLYFPEPMSPCAASTYQLDVYSQDEISEESQRDITAFYSTQSTERSVDIDSNLLKNAGNSLPNYFRISASQDCATSPYFHNLLLNGSFI